MRHEQRFVPPQQPVMQRQVRLAEQPRQFELHSVPLEIGNRHVDTGTTRDSLATPGPRIERGSHGNLPLDCTPVNERPADEVSAVSGQLLNPSSPATNTLAATANQQLPTSNWQLATGNWQPATGNWQLATSN
jgi:hypothetical protein